jgi:hypothetical protein
MSNNARRRDYASILQFISSIIIIVGLPAGFYLVFKMLDVVDQLKYASTEIGEGFMRGLQNGVNETFVNDLAKQITHTVVANAYVYRLPEPLRG